MVIGKVLNRRESGMFWQLCDVTLFLELSPLNDKSLRALYLHFSANLWRKPESEIPAIDLGFVQLSDFSSSGAVSSLTYSSFKFSH